MKQKEKNFEVADAVRDELSKLGISLMDTVNGTVWEQTISFLLCSIIFIKRFVLKFIGYIEIVSNTCCVSFFSI